MYKRQDHARARVALRGAEGDARFQHSAGVEQFCAFFGERARGVSGNEDFGQEVLEFPGEVFGTDPRIELGDHARIVIVGRAVNGEHARGFAHAQHFLPGQFPVDVSGQEMCIRDRGRITLNLTFSSLEEARDRLLDFGRGVEVLSPLALRLSVCDYARQVLSVYEP